MKIGKMFTALLGFVGCALALSACGTTQRLLLPVSQTVLSDSVMRLPAARGDRFIVLTIDDAPSDKTAEILAVLAEYKVTATFFVHTDQIDSPQRRAAMAAIQAGGHEIAHHMPADQSYGSASAEDFQQEFEKSDAILREYRTAFRPYFRPPQGVYKSRKMDPALIANGYAAPIAALGSGRRYIMASFIPWDAKSGQTDTKNKTYNEKRAARYRGQLLGNLFPGAIVIFHDGTSDARTTTTVESLRLFLNDLNEKGYAATSLAQGIERSR